MYVLAEDEVRHSRNEHPRWRGTAVDNCDRKKGSRKAIVQEKISGIVEFFFLCARKSTGCFLLSYPSKSINIARDHSF
jgi:hypothetical protein